ncbi:MULTISPECIES: GbsR/MarR family transcriptional regulator [unclassified Polaromonas]|uniref:GbsR/MarR family transcriptional regulator n=1 Tax=unclassified Polaromonas TaxID=2638319 RepID=UPI0018CA4C15|nr:MULTISPECIES: GbsR/MarR family transcriptional regulator [unclassified Polaromonas]MBG6072895.1 DNA-binding transcriptional regulator GbsR (MarR family) [Polaromonas sp. CG_9.7]MBG6114955.1 DNA-binding transcriptional regulator GbsR (MarR family) [Polaromonas sp. CG_9.2]MDH6183677.1 DNA-binding transcriptional regulator GbsR (MarR family) [Polaromonas sp. CG_23.6]
MNLAPLTQRFVLHFGEMGSRWGINRTVGQIYALLYVSPQALNADDIGDALSFSRSNVSMGLKELQSWNLVRLQHLPGDRREYFQAPEDVWAIFRTLAEERRKREIDPTLSMLRDALMEKPSDKDDIHAQERMKQMHDLIELMTGWMADVQKMDSATLVSLMKMGAKVQKLLEAKDRVTSSVKAGFKGRVPPVAAPALALAPKAAVTFSDNERS